MAAPSVLAMGYLSIDTIMTPHGCHERVPGGAALYAALGARLAGARTAIAAAVGGDYPEAWLAALAGLGIDISRVERRAGPTRTAIITYADCGGRASPHHHDSSWWERTEVLAPRIDACHGADVVVAGPLPVETLRRVVRAAHQVRVPVVADTSEAFAWRASDALLDLVPHVSIFAPSREETRLLLPGCSDDEAALALAARGPRILQKRGTDGAVAVDGPHGRPVHIAAPAALVVDATGAGDATVGALAAYVANGHAFEHAAAAALHVGAKAVSAIGPAPLAFPFPLEGEGREGEAKARATNVGDFPLSTSPLAQVGPTRLAQTSADPGQARDQWGREQVGPGT